MHFNIVWVMNREKAGKASPKQILLINPVTPFTLPGATVEQYNGYLFGSITPQIIFGFVLVFITGLAFGLAFRSIRQNIILNNLRDEFISNITHELKTPVATLSVALESLGKYRMSTDPAVMDEYLKLASQETRRLGELIDRVLNHSVLEENNSMLTVTRVNINVLIAEITSIMNRMLDNSGSVEFLPGEENIVIDGDPLFLKGVIISLIDNSIKYCDRKPEIKIFTGREKGFAVIRVNDNGPGIPDGYRKKIFEKFFRVPTGNIHTVKGFGLGLSYVKMIVEEHNGYIDVESELYEGSKFNISLPIKA